MFITCVATGEYAENSVIFILYISLARLIPCGLPFVGFHNGISIYGKMLKL